VINASACFDVRGATFTFRLFASAGVDQLIEHRVAELLPPRGVRRSARACGSKRKLAGASTGGARSPAHRAAADSAAAAITGEGV